MFRLDKVIKPWKESASLNDHINLYGFWNETSFLTKSGDVGMVLSIPGVDYESLDHVEQEYAVKRLEAALKAFGPGFHVYQYLFKSNRPDIPFASYEDPVVEAAIEQRRQFFEGKRDHLYQVEIFYAIVLEGPRSKSGIGAAFSQLFRDPAGAVGELRTQFTNNSMKVLLRSQVENELAKLDQKVQTFARQLADFMQIEVLNQQGQFRFLRRLLNYDEGRIAGRPQSTQFLDYQVVNSNIEAERNHLRVGDHFVRVLTMKEAITETRPLVLDQLLKIPANFYVVTEWTPLATDKARKEVNKRRRHFNMSKTGFVSQVSSDTTKTNPRDVLVDESKQADIENLGDCLRVLGDGQSLGDFSLTIVVYAATGSETDQVIGEFTSVFTNADGNLFIETYNQLNAYFATVPGNYAQNLRKLYLLNTNYADLSFLFTILAGEKHNAHLGAEYLAVFETENATPYFLNLHNGEVAHTLILGMTGSGKTFLCAFLLQNAQKYKPLTYIFDIGGSYQSLTSIFGGSYLNVGQESRDFTINPFSLEPTKENLQFLFSFFRVLIEGDGQRYANGYPIPAKDLDEEKDAPLKKKCEELNANSFAVSINGLPVLNPTKFPSYDPKKLLKPAEARLLGKRGTGFQVRWIQSPAESRVTYKGYICAQAFQVFPVDARGILIRLRGVAVGWYRTLHFSASTMALLMSMSGEIWVDGLDEALQFDRESFREDHELFVWLKQKIQEEVDAETTEFRKRSLRRLKQQRGGSQSRENTANRPARRVLKVEKPLLGVLPDDIADTMPVYISRLLPQLNGAYNNEWFEAAAMILRRFVETLIIELYTRRGCQPEIQDSVTNEYFMLKALIDKLNGDPRFGMQSRVIAGLKAIKELGDMAAHDFRIRIRKTDLDRIQSSVRVAIERLIFVIGASAPTS